MHMLCAAVDPHRSPYFGTPIVYAAIASLGNFLPWLPQASMLDLAVTATC
jgi:hypothetical protein